jgi:hypothetical protein
MQGAAAALPVAGNPPGQPVQPPQPQPVLGGEAAGAPALAPQPTTYLDLYLDPNKDPYNGNYVNLYQGYSPGANTPQDIRNSLYRDGNTGAFIHLLVHVRNPNADPADPGRIVAHHCLTQKDTLFCQPPAPYENVGLAFVGDLLHGHALLMVTIPDAFFTTLPVTQAPTVGHLQQLFAAQLDAAVFGPYAAGDNDVELCYPTVESWDDAQGCVFGA